MKHYRGVIKQEGQQIPQRTSGFFSSQQNYNQERTLVDDINKLNDVDAIRNRLIDYFRITLEHVETTYLKFIKPHSLSDFTYALLRGINEDPYARAVFSMSFFHDPSDELNSALPRQKGGKPIKGSRPQDLTSNDACLKLLKNIVSPARFERRRDYPLPLAQ